MPFFTRVFRGKDSGAAKKTTKNPVVDDTTPAKPSWTDAWQRTEVAPEEVQELLRGCTQELKARALDIPFLLLPYRPSSDAVNARSFIRNYFNNSWTRGSPVSGDELAHELRLTDPMVLCSVLKWCWCRLPGGVVTWEAYELFKVGEQDSHFARDAFSTFIPISIDSDARSKIIFDFFDLLAAVAAHGKSNGLGGRKLSRYAGWWAFEHADTGNGFEAAYKNWTAAADATSHLFFAYLRSISPDLPRGMSGIATLPIALQTLVQATEYPPESPTLLQATTTKVVMVVETVSPTPFALLRRAKNFEYRDSDRHLQEFAGFEDPVQSLTDECHRVLKCVASTNQADIFTEKASPSRDESWSRFEDIGFGNTIESDVEDNPAQDDFAGALNSTPQSSGGDLGRPTTPSWADFMSSGFSGDENGILRAPVAPLLLPPDKVLPPLSTGRGQSSQSHKRPFDAEVDLGPSELASIASLDLDDSFWWVWISSLANEEPATRKAVFGRCALIETVIKGAKWLVLEEQVKGAAPEPDLGAYVVEKKRFFGLSTLGKLSRRKSSAKKVTPVEESYSRADNPAPQSKTSIGPDQHARIQAAAAALQRKHREQAQEADSASKAQTLDVPDSKKTNSILTLQPSIMNEASQAMKWAKNYDKDAYRAAYLGDNRAGKGTPGETLKTQEDDKPSTPKSQPPVQSADTSSAQPPSPVSKDPPQSSPAPPVASPTSDDRPDTGKQGSTTSGVERTISESQPKQSIDSVEESGKKLKKRPGHMAFKSMFGTKKKNDMDTKPPMKATGAETSAVAAARAALESKAKAAQANSMHPQPHGPSVLKKKPVPGQQPAPINTPITTATATATAAAPAEPEKSAAPDVVEITETEPEPEARHTPKAESPPVQDSSPVPADNDTLSRVDTREQADADKEFSRFDQGPLVEQPAFTPDSPVSPVSESIPKTSMSVEEEQLAKTSIDDPNTKPAPTPFNPASDRWAQIRKNAAERAAAAQAEVAEPRLSEASRRTDDDDDDDTSADENIDNRVARIKARVAELTGNMEAAR